LRTVLASLLGFAAPSTAHRSAGSNPFEPERLSWASVPLQRLRPTGPHNASLPQLTLAPLMPFPRLQRLAPCLGLVGFYPDNALGVSGHLQGFSLPQIGHRHRLPSFLALTRHPPESICFIHLQGFVPRESP
jgi:hypothetical protein